MLRCIGLHDIAEPDRARTLGVWLSADRQLIQRIVIFGELCIVQAPGPWKDVN